MPHPALEADATAFITGGAAGIGLAIAERFAGHGMKVAIADVDRQRLDAAKQRIGAAGAADVQAFDVDVSDRTAVDEVEAAMRSSWGGTDVLVANAGVQPGSGMFGPRDAWERVLGVNLSGIINTVQSFAPAMIERGGDGAIVCTGSKQGITTPPGDPAYNVSKAGVKAFSEALAHELRNTDGCRVTAHLLIPGFVFTNLTRPGQSEKPEGAWTPEQTADYFLEKMDAGDFYILCPDNDVSRELDEKRMDWAMHDIIDNRPPLSRWHPDWSEKFDAFLKK